MQRAFVVLVALWLVNGRPAYAQDRVASGVGIPPHYVVKSHCVPGRGFVAAAQAPGHASTYPKLNLFVFKGEVVGFLFEAHEKDGWKPWYDQPQGRPVSHDDGPKHYTQTIMIRNGPSAEECKASKTP